MKHLHIVSFDVPWPPDYGGAIDVWYKLAALRELGWEITLHTFEYGRGKAAEPEQICRNVYYYQRTNNPLHLLSSIPYIVRSRRQQSLLQRLTADDSPILFEGLHTCCYLDHPALKNRIKIVRMHNLEHRYYRELGRISLNPFMRLYFNNESRKLKHFLNTLDTATAIAAISAEEALYLEKRFPGKTALILPFHPEETVASISGKGTFALYHGNLAVGENDRAAQFLIREVFSRTDMPFIIAGRQPSKILYESSAEYPHIEIRADIGKDEMQRLIRDAHLHILPTFQNTGVKLKLLNALYNGRYVIVNTPMVAGTGLDSLTFVANTSDEMLSAIESTRNTPFSEEFILNRKTVLEHGPYSREINGRHLADLLQKHSELCN